MAKLDTSLTIIGDKLELRLYGFNDKLSTLLLKILTTCKSFLPKEDRFLVSTFLSQGILIYLFLILYFDCISLHNVCLEIATLIPY